ncbi:TM2 domain-containing protein [Georgenia sp. MJ173]|uniref:TM2 domain-containing protein n=1 Tax=Georgenia sunbinii TaxID=3117728 RepID=UPI002F264192
MPPQYGVPAQYGAAPQYAGHPQYMAPPKSRIAAVLLCFFLGNLGIHNFYLGYTGRGIAQLLLAFAGYATAFILIGFVFLVPLWIWVIVEFIALLVSQQGTYSRSANGMPLT